MIARDTDTYFETERIVLDLQRSTVRTSRFPPDGVTSRETFDWPFAARESNIRRINPMLDLPNTVHFREPAFVLVAGHRCEDLSVMRVSDQRLHEDVG